MSKTLSTYLEPIESRLVVLAGVGIGRVVQLEGCELLIGRASDVGLQLDTRDISRRHARLFRSGDDAQWHIQDQGSRNGTYLNGVPLTRAEPLDAGDKIQLGTSTVVAFVEHRDVERRAFQLQKMHALAELAGGITHDMRNLLGLLSATIEYVRLALASPAPNHTEIDEALNEADGAIDRATDLMQGLLGMARGEAEYAPVDLREVLGETVRLCRRAIDPMIDLVLDAPTPLPMYGDSGQLHQVFLNLLVNARDAIGERKRGQIRVSCACDDVLGDDAPGDEREIVVSVRDTGRGMSDATLARVLEPFFTTKEVGKGTGIGLATVDSIITRHGGRIEIESEVGRGSCFRVRLPMHTAAAQRRETHQVPTIDLDETLQVDEPRARVLIVLQDRAVECALALRISDCQVTIADDAAHAASVLERARPKPDVVLLDDASIFPTLRGIAPSIGGVLLAAEAPPPASDAGLVLLDQDADDEALLAAVIALVPKADR
ncbi:MAG: FHA domain-containing protein [Myxococcales bacterium]|nr:FHA domain-containing protein [Myxococcales bacterium]